MKKIVTVDGPAGSGKSTIAKLLANRLNYTYLDTGSLYRAITHYLLTNKISGLDSERIKMYLSNLELTYQKEEVKVNGEIVNDFLRSKEINENVAAFAKNPLIRSFVRHIQKKIGEEEFCIVDGRDTGTIVFPDAFCKFYLDASSSIRAMRRFTEAKGSHEWESIKDTEKEIKKRDNEGN